MSDPDLWRLADADAYETKADRLEQVLANLAEAEQLVPDPQAASEARQLAGRYRSWVNDWRSEARRLRVEVDEVAAA
jgi:hypothetical protein